MRIYFHLRNYSEAITDSNGLDVGDLEEAKVQALEAAEELRQNDRLPLIASQGGPLRLPTRVGMFSSPLTSTPWTSTTEAEAGSV